MTENEKKALRQLHRAISDLRDYVAAKLPPEHDDGLMHAVDVALVKATYLIDC